MKNKQRKREQRKINKYVKALNKGILQDNLWRGRFIVRQIGAYWEAFEDGSGGVLTVVLEIRDLKTGLYQDFIIDNYDRGWKLFEKVNRFIVEYSGVWNNIQEVKDDKTDWTKVKWIPKKRLGYGW